MKRSNCQLSPIYSYKSCYQKMKNKSYGNHIICISFMCIKILGVKKCKVLRETNLIGSQIFNKKALDGKKKTVEIWMRQKVGK